MEEADKLLIEQLRQINVKVNNLNEIDSAIFINTLIKCFEYLSNMISKEENFIDVKFLKSQNIDIQADKFRLC